MQENNTIEQMSQVTPVEGAETQFEQPTATDIATDNAETDISYGKFKSAESLLEGYQQLEKEFTKKCQVLKEIEKSAVEYPQILTKMLEINPDLQKFAGELNKASNIEEFGIKLAEALAGKINEPCSIINDEDFLNKYVYSNEKITNKIVSDYMDSLVSLKVPQTLSKGGNSYVSPTYKPRTLDEAGKMAKKFIENRRF